MSRPFCLILVLVLELAWPWGHLLLAQDEPLPKLDRPVLEAANDETAPLLFRRIFVPADRPDDWPVGEERYLPLDKNEFNRLLEVTRAGEQAAPGVLAARITRTQYEARLAEDDALVGRAVIDVTHNLTEPALMPLDPCAVAITGSYWLDPSVDASQVGRTRPAVIGNTADGSLAVLVPRSGRLVVEWTLRGQRNIAGTVGYVLKLPASAASRLLLDLPANVTPEIERAIVAEIPAVVANTRRWSIDLGGRAGGLLRLTNDEARAQRSDLTLLRQADTYEVSPHGLDLTSILQIDVHGDPLTHLAVRIDPTVQVVGVKLGDLPLLWTMASDPESKASVARIEFAEPLSGTGRTVQISAVAPLLAAQQWRLPGVRPDAVFWQEGTISLQVRSPFALQRLQTQNCRETKTTPLAAPQSGESIEIQCFSSQATVDVEINRPMDLFRVDYGTRLGFYSGELIANLTADITAIEGGRSLFTCEVGHQWQIDSVEAQDPAQVIDWDVEGNDPHRQLLVRLGHAITVERPARLKITGRRAATLNESLGVGDLTMLNFRGFAAGRRQMLLEEPDTFDLQFSGTEELSRVNIAKLAGDDPLYSDPPPRGMAFEINSAAARLGVILVPRKPRFSADSRLDALVSDKNVIETCRIRCQPSGVAMDRLLVHLSQQREGGWQWTATSALGPLALRRLSPDEQLAAGAGSSGEAWEVSWRNPQRDAFEITGTHQTNLSGKHSLSLVALPEAAVQTGTLAIRVTEATSIEINNRRLTPLPVEASAAGSYPTFRGLFRYDPTRDGFGGDAAIEIVSTDASQEESGAFVWNCELDSRFSIGQVASHLAVFHIQTAGQPRLTFSWPEGATPRSAWVDANPIPESIIVEGARKLTVDLPVEQQFTTVSLYFVTKEPLPRLLASYSPQFPDVNAPLFERRWRVWLPSGFALPTDDLSASRYSARQPTWSQRLLGPLGRGPETATRNPFLAKFWSFQGVSSRELATARETARYVVDQFGKAESPKAKVNNVSSPTWATLLGGDGLPASTVDLRIDRAALNEVGVAPNSAASLVPESSEWDRGLARLRSANLAILVRDGHVLVTSTTIAALNTDSLVPLEHGVVYYLLDGPLCRDVLAPAATSQPLNFISLAAWTADSSAGKSHWRLPKIVRDSLAETRGWHAYQFEFSDQSSARVSVQNLTAYYCMTIAIVLITFAVGVWRSLARRAEWLALVGITCALALLLPIAWSSLVGAVFIGAASTWMWLACHRSQRNVVTRQVPQLSGSSRLLRHAIVTTVVIVLASISYCWAQSSPPDSSAKEQQRSASIARVLVPIDSAQRPVGDKVFLSESFYRALYRRAGKVLETPRGWIILNAKHRASLARQALRQEGVASELRTSLNLQVFQRNALVRLPIGGAGSRFVKGSLSVDGRLTPLDRSSTASDIAFTVEEPGAHRVELAVLPSLQAFGTLVGIELSVPAVSQSEVELTGADVTRVEVPTAFGRMAVDKEQGQILADLGSSNKLVVRWSEGSADGGTPTFELDELFWAKVQPGSMVIDLRLNVRVAEGRLRQLRLITDPRLRLLTPLGGESALASARILPGDPQLIDIDLARPIIDQGIVNLKFVVVGASGVGNLRFPRCELAGVRAAKRWLAVSVDNSLESKEQVGENLQPIAIPEFSAAWGNDDAKPQAAYRIPRGEPSWVLSTRPRATITSVDQALMLGIGSTSSTVLWNADLTSPAGYLFLVCLRTPMAMNVEQVSVLSQGSERMARWSRDNEGFLTVFLKAPVSGSMQVSLQGRIPHAEKAAVTVPMIRMVDAELNSQKLFVFRHSSVLTDLKPGGEWQPIAAPPEVNAKASLGRLAAALSTRDANASAVVEVSPNRPVTTASQVTTVGRDNDDWWAEVDVKLRVAEGVVDALYLDLPPEWTNPTISQPLTANNATLAIEEIPGETGRHLMVRSFDAVRDQFEITLRGKIAPTAGDRLRVPDVVLRGISKVERYVLLPKQVELQQVAWEMSGLSNADLPADLQPAIALPETHASFQVLGERFQATLKSLDQLAGQPKIALAETCVTWQWDGRCSGVATFDLEPAGLKSCVLEMPVNLQPVHVTVAGIPRTMAAVEPGRWQVSLGAPQLPQRIELIFAGTISEVRHDGLDWRLSLPAIEGVEAVRTLWTVIPPSRAGLGVPANELTAISPSRYELHRLQSTSDLAAIARDLAVDQPKEDAPRWYGAWWQRYEAVRASLIKIAASQHDDPAAIAESKVKIQELDKIREINPRHDIAQPASSELLSAGRNQYANEHPDARPTFCLVRGKVNALKLQFPRSPTDDFLTRFFAAAIIVGAVAIAASMVRRHGMPSVSATTLVASAGALSWWSIQPAFAGLIMLATSIVAATRRHFRGSD